MGQTTELLKLWLSVLDSIYSLATGIGL